MSREPFFKDQSELYDLYVVRGLSMKEIGRMFETSHVTVGRNLKRMGIPVRSLSERYNKNHVILSSDAIEFISGELLGDMFLSGRSSLASSIQYSSKFREYILFLRDTLRGFGIEDTDKIREYQDHRYGTFIYRYSSRSYPELLEIRKWFYPDGIKVIPTGMKLTPTLLRQWYIGDGTLARSPKPYEKPYMKIAACAFQSDDVAKAVEKINNLGIIARHHAGNIIYISPKSARDFLNYIGPSPVECYQYKWGIS